MQLAGKAALISGAGGGICRAIAVAFAEAGAAVACCDLNPEAAAETARIPTRPNTVFIRRDMVGSFACFMFSGVVDFPSVCFYGGCDTAPGFFTGATAPRGR